MKVCIACARHIAKIKRRAAPRRDALRRDSGCREQVDVTMAPTSRPRSTRPNFDQFEDQGGTIPATGEDLETGKADVGGYQVTYDGSLSKGRALAIEPDVNPPERPCQQEGRGQRGIQPYGALRGLPARALPVDSDHAYFSSRRGGRTYTRCVVGHGTPWTRGRQRGLR